MEFCCPSKILLEAPSCERKEKMKNRSHPNDRGKTYGINNPPCVIEADDGYTKDPQGYLRKAMYSARGVFMGYNYKEPPKPKNPTAAEREAIKNGMGFWDTADGVFRHHGDVSVWHRKTGQRTVETTNGVKTQELILPLSECHQPHPGDDVPDHCQLMFLSQPTLLENTRQRYFADKIYTYVGDILVAVNPFRWIEGLYGVEIMKQCKGKKLWNADCGPHVYAISEKVCAAHLALGALANARLVPGALVPRETPLASRHATPSERADCHSHLRPVRPPRGAIVRSLDWR